MSSYNETGLILDSSAGSRELVKFEKLKTENSNLLKQNLELLDHVELLSTRLRSSTSQSESLNLLVNNQNEKLAEYKLVEDELRCNIESMRARLESREAEAKQSAVELKLCQNRFESENRLRKKIEAQCSEMLDSAEQLQSKLSETNLRLLQRSNTQDSFEQQMKDKLITAQSESREAKTQLNKAKHDIKRLVGENESLARENSLLKQSSVKLTHSNTSLEERITKLTRESDKSESKARQAEVMLHETASNAASLRNELEMAKRKSALLQKQLRQTQKDLLSAQRRPAGDSYSVSAPNSPSLIDFSEDILDADNGGQAAPTRSLQSSPVTTHLVSKLKTELASKDAELQRLKVSASSSPSLCRIHDLQLIDSLRNDLTALLEIGSTDEDKSEQLDRITRHVKRLRSILSRQVSELQERLVDEEMRCAALESRISIKQKNIDDICSKYDQISAENNALSRQLKVKTAHSAKIESDLQTVRNESQTYLSRIEFLEEELAQSNASLTEANDRVSNLETELSRLSNCLRETTDQTNYDREQLQSLLTAAQSENVILSEKIQVSEVSVTSLETRYREQQQQYDELLLKANQYCEDLTGKEQLLDRLNADLEKTRQSYKEEVDRRNNLDVERESQWQKQLELCQSESEIIQTKALEELKSREDKVKQLVVQVTQFKQAADTWENERTELQRITDEKSSMLVQAQTRIAELESDEQRHHSKITALEKEHQLAVSKLSEQVAITKQQLQEAKEKTKQLSAETTRIADTKKELETQLEHSIEEKSSVSKKLKTLESSFRKAQFDLNEYRADNDHYKKLVGELEHDLEQKTDLNQQQLNQISELEQDLKRTERLLYDQKNIQLEAAQNHDALVSELKAEVLENEAVLEATRSELNAVRSEMQSREDQLQLRAQQLSQLEESIRQHKVESDSKAQNLKKALVVAEGKIHELGLLEKKYEGDVTSLRAELSAARDEVESHERSNRQLRREGSTKSELISELTKQVDTQKLLIEQQRKDCAESQQNVRIDREKAQKLESQLSQIQRELHSTRLELDKVTEELSEVCNLCSDKDMQIATLLSQVGEMEVKLATLESQSQADVRRITLNQNKEIQERQLEIDELRQTHSQLTLALERQAAEASSKQAELQRTGTEYSSELSRLQREAQRLQNLLEQQDTELRSVNESVLLKDAEIARLSAHISSVDRMASAMSSLNHSVPPASNSFQIPTSLSNDVVSTDFDPTAGQNDPNAFDPLPHTDLLRFLVSPKKTSTSFPFNLQALTRHDQRLSSSFDQLHRLGQPNGAAGGDTYDYQKNSQTSPVKPAEASLPHTDAELENIVKPTASTKATISEHTNAQSWQPAECHMEWDPTAEFPSPPRTNR